jgi:ATP-dependent HslUV protease subunit HslV
MSIVVAVKKGKDLVVASDSLTTFGSSKPSPGNMTVSKVRRVGSALVGSTSWALYDNLLTDYLGKKKSVRLSERQDIFRFFVDFWHALHKRYSLVNDQCDEKDSPFGNLDASFLVVTRKSIFHVSSDMSVVEFLKFDAIGSGADFAVGAMHVLYEQKLSAGEIARHAVEAAIAHNIYCGGAVETFKP